MLNIIIKAIFFIIGKIGDIVLLPIMAVINTVAPGLTVPLNAIFDFLALGFQYIIFFFKLLLIPSTCINIVVIVFTTYLSIILGVRSFNFIMKIYKNFKP